MSTKPTNPKDSFGSAKAGISRVPASVLTEVGLAMDEGGAKYRGYTYRDWETDRKSTRLNSSH